MLAVNVMIPRASIFLLQEDSLRRKESEIRSLNEELSNTRRKMSDLEQERSTLNVSVFTHPVILSA